MNYIFAVLALAALTVVCSGIAYLVGRMAAQRDAQVPTDVLGRKP